MPDLNSVPVSPRGPPAPIRRASSQQTQPPTGPSSPSINILPSNQSTVNASSSSSLPSPSISASASFAGPPMQLMSPGGDNTGVGPGPGPPRHPRPLTAADLHLQLEKEQEAVVNRLTRELSILRAAHNASVASNASSTSASASGTEPGPWGEAPNPLGTNTYQPVRHRRTPSSASTRSLVANAGSVSAASLTGVSSPAPVRSWTQQPPIPIGGSGSSVSLSRQNSSASRHSRTGSPSPAPRSISSSYRDSAHPLSADPASFPGGGYFAPRIPIRSHSGTSTTSALATPTTSATAGTTSDLSPGIMPATLRYEETARRRAELEDVKRENAALRRRVRELETLVREATLRKDEGRRDDTASPAAAIPEGGSAEASAPSVTSTRSAVAVGVPEEELRVGESAASSGAGRGRGRARE